METSSKKNKDKTQEYIKELESKFKAVCKKINHLLLIANTTEPGVDRDKLQQRVKNFLGKEIKEITDYYSDF